MWTLYIVVVICHYMLMWEVSVDFLQGCAVNDRGFLQKVSKGPQLVWGV